MPGPPAETFQDLHFPLCGLDVTTAYDRQPNRPVADGNYARTTPQCSNVRAFEPGSDRARGGRRPGARRYVNARVNGSASIQDLTGIVLPKSSFAVPGSTLAPGSTSTKVQALANADGSTLFTSVTLSATPQAAAYDGDRNAYVATVSAGGVFQLTKIGLTPSPAQVYQTTPFSPGAGSVLGLTAFDGVLYALVHGTAYGVYRLNPATGALLDAGAWWTPTGTPAAIAATGGVVGVLGVDGSGNLNLQQSTSGGESSVSATSTVDGGTLASFGGGTTQTARGLTADGAGNFYVAGSIADGGSNVSGFVSKVNAAGTVLWNHASFNSSGTAVYPRGVAYDAVNDRVGVVGAALFGTTDSFETLNATTGAKVAGSQPNSQASWTCVAADGAGGFRIARAATTSNVAKLASALTVAWTVSTGVSPAFVVSTSVLDDSAVDIMRSTRVLRNLAVAGGLLARFDSSAVTTIDASFLSANASLVFGQACGLKVYYLDGTQYKLYDAVLDTTAAWTAGAGALPVDDVGEVGRLICLWRGRVVVAGVRGDPQNWFMSAVDDPTDFDYSPVSPSPTQAVAGNNSPAGLVGDIVNTLIPFSDDVLFFGCDHTLWILSGDPMNGGQIDRVSDTIGTAFGRPWCKGPDGTIYFFSSRGSIYSLYPMQAPQPVSQPIRRPLADVNVGNSFVRMNWDDAAQGLHVFITPAGGGATTHYFWEQRTGGWFPFAFADADLNPKCTYVLDGDAADDRVILFGSWDGYIRQFANDAEDDDGTPILWNVAIGPLLTPDLDELLLKDVQGILAENSGSVNYAIQTGATAERALAASPAATGVWQSGRNPSSFVRRAGHAIYVVLSGQSRGALEAIRVRVAGLGKVRRRGR